MCPISSRYSRLSASKSKVKKIANKAIDKRLPLGSADIADGAVVSAKLGAGAVTTGKIAANAVGTNEVDGSLTGADVTNGSLVAADLGPVDSGSINAGSVAAQSCQNLAILDLPGADAEDLLLVIPTGNGGATPAADYDTGGELILLGVPHSGEGHIKVCNVSNAAIDPPAQSYRAVLING